MKFRMLSFFICALSFMGFCEKKNQQILKVGGAHQWSPVTWRKWSLLGLEIQIFNVYTIRAIKRTAKRYQ